MKMRLVSMSLNQKMDLIAIGQEQMEGVLVWDVNRLFSKWESHKPFKREILMYKLCHSTTFPIDDFAFW